MTIIVLFKLVFQFFLINIINLLRMNEKRTPSLFESFLPIIFLIILLSINVSIFGDDALSGSIQIVLIFSSSIAAIIAFNLGYKWNEIQIGIGLMNVDGNPFVIEYNVRMGDPETQVVIPRIKNDLLGIINDCAEGNLKKLKLDIDHRFVTTVILAANGYPNNYIKGDEIENLSEEIDTKIFHAGTKKLEDKILSNGGRVLACTGFGENINEALNNSYKIAKKISWKNKYFRKCISTSRRTSSW